MMPIIIILHQMCVYIRIYDRMLDSVFLFWRMYTVKHFINKSYQGRPIHNEQKC